MFLELLNFYVYNINFITLVDTVPILVAMRMCLSEFLHGLDFIGAKKSGDYVGTKVDNPAMILEENIVPWTRITNLEDLQVFNIFIYL